MAIHNKFFKQNLKNITASILRWFFLWNFLHFCILAINHSIMHKISIAKPCHEKWEEMTPQNNGAFCGQCSKVVIDFTKMTDDEVQNYFIQGTLKMVAVVSYSVV